MPGKSFATSRCRACVIVIAVATLLSTIWTFNNFETIFLLTQGGPGNITKVYSILAYEKAMRSLQFGPGTAIAFSLVPVLLFFILLLSRFMRRDAGSGDDITAWQDRFIDGIGMIINAIFNLIALPFPAYRSCMGAHSSPAAAIVLASIKRQRQLATIGRNIGWSYLLSFILFPFFWILITAFKSDLQISQRTGIYWPDPWTLEQFETLFY